jgi:hypothetical protein
MPNPAGVRHANTVFRASRALGLRDEVPATVFSHQHLTRLEEIMQAVCADFDMELGEFNGETNHVHLLVDFPPKVAASKLINSLKASPPAGCDRNSLNSPDAIDGHNASGRTRACAPG